MKRFLELLFNFGPTRRRVAWLHVRLDALAAEQDKTAQRLWALINRTERHEAEHREEFQALNARLVRLERILDWNEGGYTEDQARGYTEDQARQRKGREGT